MELNPTIYGNLLAEVLPRPIDSEEEYDRILSIVEPLHFKETDRTPEERALYILLFTLVEAYEKEQFPMPESTPHQMLLHLMESSGTTEAGLVGIIGPTEIVSEVVKGTRAIDKVQAKALGDRFKVSPSLFI
jgi:HTH-type transcriptional regulator / antitoxin HigA